MAFLFFGALTTTIEVITGVEARDISNWYNHTYLSQSVDINTENHKEVEEQADTFKFLGFLNISLQFEASHLYARYVINY